MESIFKKQDLFGHIHQISEQTFKNRQVVVDTNPEHTFWAITAQPAALTACQQNSPNTALADGFQTNFPVGILLFRNLEIVQAPSGSILPFGASSCAARSRTEKSISEICCSNAACSAAESVS